MKKFTLPLVLALIATIGIFRFAVSQDNSEVQTPKLASAPQTSLAVATFAGGCFWCTESDFEKLPGVEKVLSGYSGGHTINPTYQQVSGGTTGHTEAVQVYYNPAIITYEGLLQSLWRQMDPTDADGQFVDRGTQYRPAIFYHDKAQQKLAEESLQTLNKSGRFEKAMATEIVPLEKFYPAEMYHQDYHSKNPIRYKIYRYNSGRDQFLERIWGDDLHPDFTQFGKHRMSFIKPDEKTLRDALTPIQYNVTQQEGTERPFDNEYWDEKREGVYVDIISGEPLFSSSDKFDSGTGWPSFTQPISGSSLTEKTDRKLFSTRTEVRSPLADSHLGHVFSDGPAPTGLRYCINSAALKFIPKEELMTQGLESYLSQFE